MAHEILAQYETPDMRLCNMSVRAFDGMVKAGETETVEEETVGVVKTTTCKKRVLTKETINLANAFRMEVSRSVSKVGFKIPTMGVLVDTRGLETLKEMEKVYRQSAAQIYERMVEELIERGEQETLAICEVDLIALRFTPEDEFVELVERLASEAVSEKLNETGSALNETLERVVKSLEVGHGLAAQKQLSAVGRSLSRLIEMDSDSAAVQDLRTDLASAKEIVSSRELKVNDKIEALQRLKLFAGISCRGLVTVGKRNKKATAAA